jgi:8-oxo-dGTP diphosphatase
MSVIRVACGIILKDGKVLAAQRSEKMKLPLKWEFPGGKLQKGETEEDCLKREIKEELNILITIQYKLTPAQHDYGDFQIELIPFVAEYAEGNLHLHEHRQVGWYTHDELRALDWAPADIPILYEFLRLNPPPPSPPPENPHSH